MKIGQTVPVYSDMENLTGLIGYGKLIAKTSKYQDIEMWVVKLKDDREVQFVFWAKNFRKNRKKLQKS